MMTELTLQEYKAHLATVIPLGRLTVLVGTNAVGKTSVLEALLILSRLLDAPAKNVFVAKNDLRWLVRRGAADQMKLCVCGSGKTGNWDFLVTAPSTGALDQVDVDWTDRVRVTEPGRVQAMKDVFGEALRKQRSPIPPEGTASLRNAMALRLEPTRLAEPSFTEDEIPRLSQDGYGLATALSFMKLTETERFIEMERLACQIVPRLKRIGFKRTKIEQSYSRASKGEKPNGSTQEIRTVPADELLLDYVDARELPAHAASEGTLLVLGILCAMYSPTRPNLLLLDDIDRGLHPTAQNELLKGLYAALEVAPDLQIVGTSHSPYLVDALEPSDVVVLARRANSAVAAKRLSEHPKADLLDVLSTGELWTAEGESWATAP
jgi:predicted ATPase